MVCGREKVPVLRHRCRVCRRARRRPDGSRRYATSASELHPVVEKVVLNLDGDAGSYGDWNSETSIGMGRPRVSLAKHEFTGPPDWQSKTREALAKYFGKNGRDRQPIVIDGPIRWF